MIGIVCAIAAIRLVFTSMVGLIVSMATRARVETDWRAIARSSVQRLRNQPKYQMRNWINLFEANRWNTLYWFWYNPSTATLVHVDGTHTGVAAYELGFPTQDGSEPDIEDEDVIGRAIAAGWVRGRYGDKRSGPDGNNWLASYELQNRNPSYTLSLQGRPEDVLETAREITRRRRVSDLYVDFTSGARMESHHLEASDMATYLDTGQIQASG